ncbi:DUF4402 domain-containing protein [Polaribacter glomeratus]|uniref:DUF4402 domain-containing protein n=1 Tax=Polaribacter glomeratus TaxID=102 RepID=A0A2S7WF78_9FLAO|nr:DUF4402 domain-containing protein [Polaribacter glomeratus]PQJ76273.1 hypothetical protein BTO16_10140 [Polaribacter glomeratus]TXD63811.1 DUF4402 domain-containing protein [Polaribacter glomeratus]
MKITQKTTRHLFKGLQLAILFLFATFLQAQPDLPERGITLVPTQAINFGVFCISGSGTIEVDFQGNVNVTGGVVSINTTTVTPAIFEIKLCQGRTITMNYDYSVFLNGSNGGQLELIIGGTERGISGDIFASENNCNFITPLRVGGKLIVPANAVPGMYTGVFPMSFTQE